MKIGVRLTIALLVAAIVPLLLAGIWLLYQVEDTLEDLGRQAIQQRAESVARQVDLYLAAHPDLDPDDLDQLGADADLGGLALQPVGQTGYTVLFNDEALVIFHTNLDTGFDLHTLAGDLPEFWALLESSLDGSPREGYYDWREGGQIRPKYMSITAVPGTPLRVAATTYIEEFSQPASTFRLQLLLALVVVGLLAAAGAVLIGRRISQPIGQMVGAANEVANGDLAVEMPVTRVGELEQLAAAFAQMTGNLSSVIRQVRTLTLNLSSATGQVVMTQRQHAANSGEQAAAVTSASAAVEELASSSAYIADTSRQVVAAAGQTQANTQRGVEAMADAASRLERISEGNQVAVAKVRDLGELARQIGVVMDLIEDIAAHTKLIAFNASIEASAAGEAGRRFAVVAAEVRHLAGNVAQSTEEIRAKVEQIQTTTNELIIASEKEQREIESGLTISGTMTDLLDQILDSAQQTTQSVEQISLSTQQQRTATEQLLGDLYPLTSSASTIAAGSQQTVDVMENLAAMARELQAALDRFHLPEVASTMANAE